MIFVTLGTQKFQLNRLLKEIDFLIEKNVIEDEVFAQIGHSTYEPKHFKYEKMMSQSDFHKKIRECNVLISHAGVGSTLNGLKFGKKIILYPRLAKYGEHIDDHQLDLANKYYELGYCLLCDEKHSLEDCLKQVENFESKYVNSESENDIADYIINFIENTNKKQEN